MKKILLSLLAVIVVLGLFGAAGYAGYRLGYAQGVQTKITANGAPANPSIRPFNNFFGFGPRRMPAYRFRSGPGFRRGGSPMGFWVFPLAASLARAAILVAIFLLVIGFIYWVLARSGWRLTRQPVESHQSAETHQPPEDNSPKG